MGSGVVPHQYGLLGHPVGQRLGGGVEHAVGAGVDQQQPVEGDVVLHARRVALDRHVAMIDRARAARDDAQPAPERRRGVGGTGREVGREAGAGGGRVGRRRARGSEVAVHHGAELLLLRGNHLRLLRGGRRALAAREQQRAGDGGGGGGGHGQLNGVAHG